MGWYMQALRKYAVFKGRSQRKEFWTFTIVNFLAGSVLGAFALASYFSNNPPSYGILSTVFAYGIMVPSIMVAVRRMHDVGRSGWWSFVPLVGLIFCIEDSQPGQNKYGANPKGNEGSTEKKPVSIILATFIAIMSAAAILEAAKFAYMVADNSHMWTAAILLFISHLSLVTPVAPLFPAIVWVTNTIAVQSM